MTIKRTINGIVMKFELTAEEKRQAFNEQEREYRIEDILSRYEVPEDKLNEVVERVDDALLYNDSYWESFWFTIEDICDEYGFEKVED